MGLLDGGIAKLVRQGLKSAGMYKPATLVVVTAGTRTVGALSGGTNPTTASVACEAIPTAITKRYIGGTLVQDTDRAVLILGDSLGTTVPTTKDKLTIEGTTQQIVGIERDAASATYLCLCRG